MVWFESSLCSEASLNNANSFHFLHSLHFALIHLLIHSAPTQSLLGTRHYAKDILMIKIHLPEPLLNSSAIICAACRIGEFRSWKTLSEWNLFWSSYHTNEHFILPVSCAFGLFIVSFGDDVASIKHLYAPGKEQYLVHFGISWQLAECWTHGRCSINIFFFTWLLDYGENLIVFYKRSYIMTDVKSSRTCSFCAE